MNESGVPVLFANLANQIAKKGIYVSVIDYLDGVISRRIDTNEFIQLIPFEDGKFLRLNGDVILVQQSIVPYTMRPELVLGSEVRLLFWNLHPSNLIPVIIPLPFIRRFESRLSYYKFLSFLNPKTLRAMRSFIREALSKKSLIFMDGVNVKMTNKFLSMSFSVNDFLQVPSKVVFSESKRSLEEVIQITWVGRLCDFKIWILHHTIQRLDNICKIRAWKINVNVIGSGTFEHVIRSYRASSSSLTINYLGELNMNQLEDFLVRDTDIFIGMGTAALEAASLKIPTILCGYSYEAVDNDYIYNWLYESTDYSLGDHIDKSNTENNNKSLEKRIEEVLLNKNHFGFQCREYVNTYHRIDNIADRFLILSELAELKYENIERLVKRKSLLRRIYNVLKYKIL